MSIVILAIESSCDETSASVCVDGKIISNLIANQTIHEKYGGVVPELASRAHMQNILPVVDQALSTANCQLSSDPSTHLLHKIDPMMVQLRHNRPVHGWHIRYQHTCRWVDLLVQHHPRQHAHR